MKKTKLAFTVLILLSGVQMTSAQTEAIPIEAVDLHRNILTESEIYKHGTYRFTTFGDDYNSYKWWHYEVNRNVDSAETYCENNYNRNQVESSGDMFKASFGDSEKAVICVNGSKNGNSHISGRVFDLKDVDYMKDEWGGCSQPGQDLVFNAELVGSGPFASYDEATVKGCWSVKGVYKAAEGMYKEKRLRGVMLNVGYTDKVKGEKKTSWISGTVNTNTMDRLITPSCDNGDCSLPSSSITDIEIQGDGGIFKVDLAKGKTNYPVDVHMEMLGSYKHETGGKVKGGENGLSGSELRKQCDTPGTCDIVNQIDFTVDPDAAGGQSPKDGGRDKPEGNPDNPDSDVPFSGGWDGSSLKLLGKVLSLL
ncbi:MAG: hypothetical protein ABEJ95_03990 [Candidatus Nanohalobium sp.]